MPPDLHSHLLPGMDDGCSSRAESLELLQASYAQGITAMVATPHYYPTKEDPSDFIARRDRALDRLREAINEKNVTDIPKIYVGAEVAYFNGISRCDNLRELCIVGTNVILIEMPFHEWSENVLAEITSLGRAQGVVPIIAHIERYIGYQSVATKEYLLASEMLIQSNAESFIVMKTRKNSLDWLKNGHIDLLGSDSHGMEGRTQNLRAAVEIISHRLGESAVRELAHFGMYLLDKAERVI
jgi:protein-tyrosine phosphatase